MTFEVMPCTLDESSFFINAIHRHHRAPVGHKFSLACYDYDSEKIVGVCTVGRPVSRIEDNGLCLEVNRLCTDGTKNACSFLYSAAWRAAKALGYKRLITYILNTESGVSLTAAGWKLVGESKGGSWSCKSRPRIDKHPTQGKLKYETGQTAIIAEVEAGE